MLATHRDKSIRKASIWFIIQIGPVCPAYVLCARNRLYTLRADDIGGVANRISHFSTNWQKSERASQATAMERIRAIFKRPIGEPLYEPLDRDSSGEEDDVRSLDQIEAPFSWLEYSVFLLLGVAMLWAW